MAEIPEAVQSDLCRIGGVEGLVEQVPPLEELVRRSGIYRALSDPIRLTILHLLSGQPLCVCVIKEVLAIGDSNLSYHLNVLKQSGLVASAQAGNWLIYRLTDEGRRYLERGE